VEICPALAPDTPAETGQSGSMYATGDQSGRVFVSVPFKGIAQVCIDISFTYYKYSPASINRG
jgi:hypothetical protein